MAVARRHVLHLDPVKAANHGGGVLRSAVQQTVAVVFLVSQAPLISSAINCAIRSLSGTCDDKTPDYLRCDVRHSGSAQLLR